MTVSLIGFALLAVAAADAAVLRDLDARAHEVDAAGRVTQTQHPEPLAHAARKESSEPTKAAVARSHQEWTAAGLSYAVLTQALLDPFALCGCLALVAYCAFRHLMPEPKPKVEVATRPWDAVSTSSAASATSRLSRARAPDRFALVVNQKLTRFDTVDEVLDFALASAETGRTDIVNAVTAIHRSAKLVAGQPQLQRIRVGQDPRLCKLLGHLQQFIDKGDQSPSILSRAVGNTSWALAKLHYRPDADVEAEGVGIVDTLQNVFVQYAAHFRPEEMMNTVWAFAEMRRDRDGAQGEERVFAVAQAACSCIDKFGEFTLQQVVYLSWALARLSSINTVKYDSAEVRAGLLGFTCRIVARARPDIRRLTTKNLAMLSWACASLHTNLGLADAEGDVAKLLTEISEMIAQKGLAGFLPGEIASIVWAVNKVHVRVPAFFALFREHLLHQGLRGFSSQDVSTILCAFVKTGCGSDALYDMLAEKASALAKDFNRSEKMMVHWAYTQLPHLTPPKL